jgi:hypothetical protein
VVGAAVVVVAELRSTLGATIGAADVLADHAMANVAMAMAPNITGSPMAPMFFAIRISSSCPVPPAGGIDIRNHSITNVTEL